MALDVRVAQTALEDALRDALLLALGKRLPAVASVAALRAVPTQTTTGTDKNDDDLIAVVVGGVVQSAWRWSTTSTATDDGVTAVKPADVVGAGRWLAWTSPLRLARGVGDSSSYLHEVADGGLVARVIVLDRSRTPEEVYELLTGDVPSIFVEATDDDPDDATQVVGHRWVTEFHFTVSVVAENLRDRRQAARGSDAPGDELLGANALDGLAMATLVGTQLSQVVPGLMWVRAGRGRNWVSELMQRRVVRSRDYRVCATVENPAAPNDAGAAQGADAQASMAAPGDGPAFDLANYVVSGCAVALGPGLVRSVGAGSAVIGGVAVAYAGQVRTFAASSDTYRDLAPSGIMTFSAVGVGADPPAVAAGSLRVGVTRTDASSATDDRYVAGTLAPYMNRFQHDL